MKRKFTKTPSNYVKANSDSFWNDSDESVLNSLCRACQKMGYFYCERGDDAYNYYEYKYAKQIADEAKEELLSRLSER